MIKKKDLINEYKSTKQNEAPDLWSRIEEGIDNIAQTESTIAKATPSKEAHKHSYAGRFVFGFAALALAMIIISHMHIALEETDEN